MKKQKGDASVVFTILIVVICLFGIGSCMAYYPKYKVYKLGLEGEARQAYANMERQSIVAQAQAERDAAELRAAAIEIMGEAAKNYPEYRQQEFIGAFAKCLENGCASQIIYVPTEAGIPITESQRLRQ